MMAVLNPVFSLKNLNDIENRVLNNQATPDDYQTLEFFITAIGGNQGFLKGTLVQNGFKDFSQYIREKNEDEENRKVAIGKVHGTVMGTLSFLKSYAIQNNFYV